MTVKNLLHGKGNSVFSVSPRMAVREALHALADKGIGAILVLDEQGKIAGILSERDVARALVRLSENIMDMKVADLMTKNVITCRMSDSVADVMGLMTKNRIRHVPVMDGGILRGLISIGDVVNHRLKEMEQEAEHLRDYIATA